MKNLDKKQYTKPEAEIQVFFSEEDIAAVIPVEENALSMAFYGEEISLL